MSGSPLSPPSLPLWLQLGLDAFSVHVQGVSALETSASEAEVAAGVCLKAPGGRVQAFLRLPPSAGFRAQPDASSRSPLTEDPWGRPAHSRIQGFKDSRIQGVDVSLWTLGAVALPLPRPLHLRVSPRRSVLRCVASGQTS